MSTVQKMFSTFSNLQRHERKCNGVETGKKTDIENAGEHFHLIVVE